MGQRLYVQFLADTFCEPHADQGPVSQGFQRGDPLAAFAGSKSKRVGLYLLHSAPIAVVAPCKCQSLVSWGCVQRTEAGRVFVS